MNEIYAQRGALMLQAASSIFGFRGDTITHKEQQQLFLPIRMGGFGLRQ